MSFFTVRMDVRLTEATKKKVDLLLKHNKNVFDNESHVVRSAINFFYANWSKKGMEALKNG